MTVVPIRAFFDNYIWAMIDKEAKAFDCVDPGEERPVVQFAQAHELTLRSILVTHHHADHTGGICELVKTYPSCLVYGPKDSRIPSITHPIEEHQMLHVGACGFKVFFNPGHTSTHISYYEPQKEWLFCGDTLFSAGCGRVFDGTLEQLHQSLCFFKTLPPTTQIFCAHEYTQQNLRFAQTVEPHNEFIRTTIQELHDRASSCTLPSTLAHEQLINPFLRTTQPEVQQFALNHGANSLDSLEVFRILRNEKNAFK